MLIITSRVHQTQEANRAEARARLNELIARACCAENPPPQSATILLQETPRPELYTRSFTVKISYDLIPDNDVIEMFCTQNEKDRIHTMK